MAYLFCFHREYDLQFFRLTTGTNRGLLHKTIHRETKFFNYGGFLLFELAS